MRLNLLIGVCLLVGLSCAEITMASGQISENTPKRALQPRPSELEDRLLHLASTLEHPAIDARVDRVWYAIPGLSGWVLNVPASVARTEGLDDEQLHLVWNSLAPKQTLKTLPPQPIYRGPETEKSVSLMFNVSWGEEYVPAILATLAQHRVSATFFLDGAWIKRHPELARKIFAAGHGVESHGTGHPDFQKLSEQALEKQITLTNQLIATTVGQAPLLIAPPAGSYDMRLVKLARRHGLYTILWTTDTIDWKRPTPNIIVRRATVGVPQGAFVLMHPTAPTAQALPDILESLQQKGYVFKTVEQVIAERPVASPPVALSKRP